MQKNYSNQNSDSRPAMQQGFFPSQHALATTPDLRVSTPSLSNRQLQIAALVAEGYSNRDIAKQLNLTEQIVKNVVHSLFDRLGVWNRVELANYFSEGSSSSAIESARSRIERDRLTELRRLEILDTSAERIFDELASLAATIFEVPIALVCICRLGANAGSNPALD